MRLARMVPGQVGGSARDILGVLALPRARLVAITSLLARLPKGMLPLATVLLLRQATGSYAIAGLTAGLIAVGDAASTPLQGRLVDRLGRGRVLLPIAVLHVAAVTGLLVLASDEAPPGLTSACALVAGIGLPPVSGAVKAAWPQLAGADRQAAAYTLESLLQQLLFLAGPLLVALCVAAAGPACALACSAGLVIAGTATFVMVTPAASAAVPAPPAALNSWPGIRPAPGAAWRLATLRALVASTMLQSMAFGALPVGLAAVTAAARLPGLAGVVQAALTAGGLAGTFAPAGRAGHSRYVRLAGGFAAALAPVAVLSADPVPAALVAIGASLAVAGLFLTPIAATSYVLTREAAAPGQQTEAFAWLSTGQAAGNAAGAALAGFLTATSGAAVAMGVLPAAAALGAVLARSQLPRESRP